MRLVLLILMCFFLNYNAYCYVGSEFLLLDTSVRASSLGGAYTGTLSGIDGIHYNPASLGAINNLNISFENISFSDDMRFKYLALAKSIFKIPIAVSAGMVTTDDIPIYDINENYEKDIQYYDFFASASAAYKFKYFYTGINIKYIYRRIEDYKASGIAFDIGVLKKFNIPFPEFLKNNKDNLGVGIALKNLGTKLKFNKESDSLPTEIVIGINTDIVKNKIFSSGLFLDTGKIFNDDFSIKTGIEIGYKNTVFLRAGKSFIYNNFFTTGLSLHLPLGKKVKSYFGYSLSMLKDFNNNHTIGIILGF